jgi:hypothetical protein
MPRYHRAEAIKRLAHGNRGGFDFALELLLP